MKSDIDLKRDKTSGFPGQIGPRMASPSPFCRRRSPSANSSLTCSPRWLMRPATCSRCCPPTTRASDIGRPGGHHRQYGRGTWPNRCERRPRMTKDRPAGTVPVAMRDQRFLLSAAIYRLLRRQPRKSDTRGSGVGQLTANGTIKMPSELAGQQDIGLIGVRFQQRRALRVKRSQKATARDFSTVHHASRAARQRQERFQNRGERTPKLVFTAKL